MADCLGPRYGEPYQIVALATLQFSVGGLFDSEPVGHDIHLIRMARNAGTPGPTLCGIDRFAPDAPGWGVGGGVSDPEARACAGCVEVATTEYPGLPVWGSTFAEVFDLRPAPWDTRNLDLSYEWTRP
ncbi:hypothetical protein PBI_TEAMOCIL_93 [Microbacterium phage Teamocil]|uniref:Uncharacterized protein n=2 Tax=Metamorphoovirus TaxID=2733195 RepID=A0A649VXU7_9CAUD|nr:hypothetical protein QDA11_gp88 [Microbacterium phage Jayden]YP_010752121.1 hypothetical protein QDA12_gp93 [Microbacterium phage Teamocil]QGJ88944.1 hypothetical protein PBI_GINA_93 [Microbacterium phage Gina]QGJ95307.1 hypothetical protein PBI_JAYDEN_88 [Microbacterium phage Jayden]QGJ97041.1 hypothetical protein PBI_TEAMOCIL_93 [Microbacterium phage Teamocil]